MKRELTFAALLLLALGVVVTMVRALDMIGADTLRLLALVLAVPAGIAVMAAGLTPLVRAWRLPTAPPVERHVIKETRLQHTIDQRTPMPAPQPMPMVRQINLYPGLQSAEWRAGLLTDGSQPGEMAGWETQAPTENSPADSWMEWR